ncbi:CHAT domain-containing protein [Aerosakkonemataceae cyanobacterium BLCC-F50]|uniref:CHAT domain-containing protein n=1 Tax=Floridaenema flaviceps BLCC-F50 TaxID=3153642 RepID=A0ABV4XIU1_9CYAN
MSKLVILSFGNGSLEIGFQPITLRIFEDNHPYPMQAQGKLPPAPIIRQLYARWQSNYHGLSSDYRLSRLQAVSKQRTNYSRREIEESSEALKHHLRAWLCSDDFRLIREELLVNLSPTEEVRVIIETRDVELRVLPWHEWDFFDKYRSAEVALSPLNYQRTLKKVGDSRIKARILAILGDSYGINVQADRKLLEDLPNANIVFLAQPSYQEVDEQLWDAQGWDILFFAGHSISEANNTTGKLFINPSQYLTISQLRNPLKNAISRGLKLAIFNSCDGLGIAQQLEDLNIPQIIVMREPVPDLVAQEFLKYFLAAFSRGEPLCLAMREARERLQVKEYEFPCVTWLPVLCQNPAEVPANWLDICGNTSQQQPQPDFFQNSDNDSDEESCQKNVIDNQKQGKLIVIKIVSGSFEEGFTILLQIANEGEPVEMELQSKLPSNPEIINYYRKWQEKYLKREISINSYKKKVVDNLNSWLNCQDFLPKFSQLLIHCTSNDHIRVILQASDIELQRLPWHLWELFERYTRSEIAFSLPEYQRFRHYATITREQIKILAILGNDDEIDVKKDQQIIDNLPDVKATFLVKPEPKEISDQLWEQSWDILFFAGHSQTQDKTGRIYINETDSLAIEELKYGLRQAIGQGLQLAIFNSCDGLGLAHQLASLNIPQIIVMREPVPNLVAREFLKYFLSAFHGGKPLYLAVREARERLQGLEGKVPCATWLPVIYQNTAAGVPPTWEELYRRKWLY